MLRARARVVCVYAQVGEKTAFRRRLLEAWKMVHQLKFNAQTHYWRQHLFNALIIAFTWISVVFGTVTYEMKEGSISEENTTPRLYGLQISPQVLTGVFVCVGGGRVCVYVCVCVCVCVYLHLHTHMCVCLCL